MPPNNLPHNLLRHHVTGAIERGEKDAIVGIPAVPVHYHVASGLAGYGPNASDTDGYATFDTVGDALEYARDELSTYADMAHEGAHAYANQGQYEDAWREIMRMETLETLRANLDPARQQAPAYKDDPAAYAQLQAEQAAAFPHDVSHNSRLYLWECPGADCLLSEES